MTEDDRRLLIADVKLAESPNGKPVLRAYQDSLGVWTIGHGRNLQTMVITAYLAQRWLLTDLQVAEGECRRSFQWFDKLSSVRQRVLVEMCFQLGMTKLTTFRKFLSAMARGDYQAAVVEMFDSRWAEQTPTRVERLADMMRKG